MLDHAGWDRIADAVNPTVGVITLLLALAIRRPGNPPRWAQPPLVLLCVAFVYLLRWLDARYGLWSAAGLDYSTHTGVYVAIAASLWMIDWRLGIAGIAIGLGYVALMLQQKYHGVGDIAATAAVIVPVALSIWVAARRLFRRR